MSFKLRIKPAVVAVLAILGARGGRSTPPTPRGLVQGVVERAEEPIEGYRVTCSTFFGNADQSEARSTVDALYAVLERDFGGVQLKNTLRATQCDKFYQNVYPRVAVVDAGNVRISAYSSSSESLNVFNHTDLTTKFKTGSLEYTLQTGIELGHQDSDNERRTGLFGASTSATVSAISPLAHGILMRAIAVWGFNAAPQMRRGRLG